LRMALIAAAFVWLYDYGVNLKLFYGQGGYINISPFYSDPDTDYKITEKFLFKYVPSCASPKSISPITSKIMWRLDVDCFVLLISHSMKSKHVDVDDGLRWNIVDNTTKRNTWLRFTKNTIRMNSIHSRN
jgi:hypothetical protein